jgi:hypothetical protein
MASHTASSAFSIVLCWIAVLGAAGFAESPAESEKWRELPGAGWEAPRREVKALPGQHLVALGYPAKDDAQLAFTSAEGYPAGLYQLRLVLRPSHTGEAMAFNGGLRVSVDEAEAASFEGIQFARVHQPETKTCLFVHRKDGPLSVTLAAYADPKICESAFTAAKLKQGGPALNVELLPGEGAEKDEGEGIDDLVFIPAPSKAFYYVLDRAEVAPVSRSGYVSRVSVNKVRYDPGETLRGSAIVQDVAGKGGKGTLTLYLEHGLKTREKLKELPVALSGQAQKLDFSVPLPTRELGHALAAVYASDDGRDVSEAAEYFNIADNFFRVAIHGGLGGHGHTKLSPERMGATAQAARSSYVNCAEVFAWAEEDMVEMSPETDYWFSGQTNYHLRKKGLQDAIRIAHESGISAVTYGKFIMSGYLGWKTAYDYPNDHKGQYFYPVGMWEGVDVLLLDRFRYKEFVPYENRPVVHGERGFNVWWQNFMPINPDHTPRMARIAAEEVVRSIEMFGWDAIRWDGHPRGGGGTGGSGDLDYYAARRTQTLVRYFKDVVNAKFPKFRHGYNYLFVQGEPNPGWAYEDFELDELCRGGGLLMNESIRNSAGRPFEWIARNIQVEGDLCRERGGYLLGISCDGASPRDALVEQILYFAGGCRPMGLAGANHVINRYGTRYSCYTFDETLRRLDKPEAVIKPLAATKLWWQPFVYETAAADGASQLVVNLLNVPRQESAKQEKDAKTDWDMCPGTDPVTFQIALPDGYQATAAGLIDPFTLEVTSVGLADGKVDVPPVALWKLLVVDLKADSGVESLAARCGAPRTFGVQRKGLEIERCEPVTLDISKPAAEVTRVFAGVKPPEKQPQATSKAPNLDEMSWAERNQTVLAIKKNYPPEAFIAGWWKGGSLPADLKLKDQKMDFGDLTPVRNGRIDIFYGRGAIDYRLRFNEILATLPRYTVHDAPLYGVLRQQPGMGLRNGVSWQSFPDYDLLLYTAIPHCAIGVENSYALVEYVKAGGAVFMTGGEYAFGKGGLTHTVLDRELLPVHCVETVDTRYVETPLALEPGPDFDELGVKLDFAAKPAFWCWNQVAVKEGGSVKVFLKSGNRPILVGWTLGKGRVACFLVDHRGRSEEGVTAFFDWHGWPELARAVIGWLAPDALRTDPPREQPRVKERLAKVREQLEKEVFGGDEAVPDEKESDEAADTLPGEAGPESGGSAGRELDKAQLAQRLALLKEAMSLNSPELSPLLAEQLAAVTNLPFQDRNAVVDFIRSHPFPELTKVAKRLCKHKNTAVRSSGHQLLAAAGSPGFVEELKAKPHPFETEPLNRSRYLAVALAMFPKPDLQSLGKGLVEAWNKDEAEVKNRWTGGGEFSLAAPAHPCLDAESLFQRVAWLAYLSRYEPETYGAQFAREWLMTAQYEDYCDRTIAGLWGMNMTPSDIKRAQILSAEWGSFMLFFSRLRDLTQPDLEAVLKAHPDRLAEGFAAAHFTLEARKGINFLANHTVEETRQVLETLKAARHPMLKEFAEARLETGGRR